MSTDFDEISSAMQNFSKHSIQQQKRIQENQQQRNKKFTQCLNSYLNHLKQQIHQLESTENNNDARNVMISSTFQNVYDRIMVSSQVALRKVKQTCFQKKQFWDKLIKNNADLNDLELKKDFHMQRRDAQDRYLDAIQNQKNKKIPYNLLLGKLKQKHSLLEWQANNKKLQQQVTKGTKTLKQWKIQGNGTKPTTAFQRDSQIGNDSVLNAFATRPQSGPWTRAPLIASRYNSNNDTGSILNNFQLRKI